MKFSRLLLAATVLALAAAPAAAQTTADPEIEQLLAIGGIAFGAVYGLRPLLTLRRTRLAEAHAPPRPSEESVAA